MNSTTLTVFNDSGTTHSFISFEFVNRPRLPIFELPYNPSICTPVDEPVKTTQVCIRCPFKLMIEFL